MTWDELAAAGMCECGRQLSGHPPLIKPPPLQSWHSATSGPRGVRLGLITEEGLAQATVWLARRAMASRTSNEARGRDPARTVGSSRSSGRRTRRTAPPVVRARP
jgi:hypothetical protein